MSASFQHILGIFDFREQFQLFSNYHQYSYRRRAAPLQKWANQDREEIKVLNLLRPAPRMWVSFHLGVYQWIPLRLMIAGISVCLIVSRSVLQEYRTIYAKLVERIPLEGKLCFQEAEDPKIFFALRRFVKMGFHIFVFADGAFGSINHPNKNLAEVKLLEGSIRVRSGYINIASLFNLPITKIIEHSLDPHEWQPLKLYEIPNETIQDHKDFHDQCLGNLYRSFEKDLVKFPHLWETWRYLHRYYHPRSELLNWNSDYRIIPLQAKNEYMLLDKFTYRSHQIDKTQYESLSRIIF